MDEINKPTHYNQNGIETIDLIKESMSHNEFNGYLRGNILKYISRYTHKHKEEPVKDLLKAKWYLEKLIKNIIAESSHGGVVKGSMDETADTLEKQISNFSKKKKKLAGGMYDYTRDNWDHVKGGQYEWPRQRL